MAAALGRAAEKLPANKNIRWALGSNLWNSFPGTKFSDILDVMHDTGFIGLRLTQFPKILDKYEITEHQLQAELSKRDLHIITISFNGSAEDKSQHAEVLKRAREAMTFLKRFGANVLVVFSPKRGPGEDAFKTMCHFYNQLGETAGEMGFKAGLHNHLGQMVQTPEEVDRCMELTDPTLFHFSPDTAHIYLGGGDVAPIMEKHKARLVMTDYKDAKRAGLEKSFVKNIYDLGDGEIDLTACHRVLRSIQYKGWICVDLDIARVSPRASYERCDAYITGKLETVYA
jgi:inosose dehydratase